MSILEAARLTLVGSGSRIVPTNAATEESLAIPTAERAANRRGWQSIIDTRLIEWGRDPGVLADEGVTVPSRAIVARACEVAMFLRDQGDVPPPLRVVPSPDGGIALERWTGTFFETLEICDDGSVELTAFDGGRLVLNSRLD